MKFDGRQRGQLTIEGVIVTFITVTVYALAIYPVLNDVISSAGITGPTGLVLNFIPLVMALMILLGVIHYGVPGRYGGNQGG